MATRALDYIITIRLNKKSVRKLDALAQASHRTRGGVVATLIDLAEPNTISDLRLLASMGSAEEPEPADVVG
jgi:hypothetical protein